MSSKGQALLEFVLILPILLLLFLSMFDIGKILYEKNRLEGILNDVVIMYYNGQKDIIENEIINNYNDIEIEFDTKNNIIYLGKSIDIIAPGLNLVLNNPYEIKVSRVVVNEL